VRYSVDVNGVTIALDVTRDGVRRVAADGTVGDWVAAELVEVPGSPVRLLRLGAMVVSFIARATSGVRGGYTVVIDGERYAVEAVDERQRAIRAVSHASAVAHRSTALRAPMPGLIVRVEVAVGDRVVAGQGLIVMEAMKMENELRAPTAGTVRAIAAAPGIAVEKGALLVELE
jgi:biotin carboxyl carrier protein